MQWSATRMFELSWVWAWKRSAWSLTVLLVSAALLPWDWYYQGTRLIWKTQLLRNWTFILQQSNWQYSLEFVRVLQAWIQIAAHLEQVKIYLWLYLHMTIAPNPASTFILRRKLHSWLCLCHAMPILPPVWQGFMCQPCDEWHSVHGGQPVSAGFVSAPWDPAKYKQWQIIDGSRMLLQNCESKSSRPKSRHLIF